jgi:hypothetical protein
MGGAAPFPGGRRREEAARVSEDGEENIIDRLFAWPGSSTMAGAQHFIPTDGSDPWNEVERRLSRRRRRHSVCLAREEYISSTADGLIR